MIPHTTPTPQTRGAALLISVMFLMLTSTAVVSTIALPLIKNLQIVQESRRSRESLFLAEALVEDILYRYKAGMDVDLSETLTINGHSADAVITTTPFGRTVTVTADVDDAVRRVQTDLIAGVGASFGYGVQSGTGGFILHNSATVEGNVYSNGSIIGENGAAITGSAFAANSAELTANQSNTAPVTPADAMVFGNANPTQDVAQSFELSSSGRINKVQLYIKKIGNPGSATVRLTTSSGGNPSGTTLASATLASGQVTTSFGWVEAVFSDNPELTAGTTYWIVIDNSSSNAANHYSLAANTDYADGAAKIGRWGTSWSATTPAGLDGYFSIFLGGVTSVIDNVDVGTAGVGDAHAHTVTGSTIAGALYCQTGSGNNKACDTSRSDPAPQGFPISQANIDQWKEEAEAGGVVSGDYVVDGTTAVLGPAKITGNLTVTNGATLTMTGTIWVEGTISVNVNGLVRVDPAYGANSGVLLADGIITVNNNGNFQGSGTTGSYLLLLTTSDCPISSSCAGANAITLANNVGTVVLSAQYGTLYFSNNAGAKQATAHTIELAQNAEITYETGLIDLNFVSGPGGAFDITGWKEIE
jgi:hypothetical protein